MGIQDETVTEPNEIGSAWDRALAGSGPALLDIRCDPEIAPIPPHATLDQMTSTARSLLKGDPHAFRVLFEGAKTKLQELRPDGNK